MRIRKRYWAVLWPAAVVLMLGAAFAHMRFRVDRAETVSKLEHTADEATSPARACFSDAGARLLSARDSLGGATPDRMATRIVDNLDPVNHCEAAVFITSGAQVVNSIPEFARQKYASLPVESWSHAVQAVGGASGFHPLIEGPYENSSGDWYVVLRVPYNSPANGWIAAVIPIIRLFDSDKLREIGSKGVDYRISGVTGLDKNSNVYLRRGGSGEFTPVVRRRIAVGSNSLVLELSPFTTDISWRTRVTYVLLSLVLSVCAGAMGYESHAEALRLQAEIRKRDQSLKEIKAQRDIAIRTRGDMETLSIGAAYQDVMTGLPNWFFFLEHVNRSMQRLAESDGNVLTMVLAELDHLSDLQKQLDSTEMDELLQQTVARFEHHLRPSDLLASRLGSGELAFLFFDSGKDPVEAEMSRHLKEVLDEPFVINGKTVILSTSLGFSSSRNFHRSQELVQEAEIKLEIEKARLEKKSRVRRKELAGDIKVNDRQDFMDISAAIERDELRLEYLPIVNLDTRKVLGVEVLARWHHPFKGIISPSRFVPLAEATGQAEFLTKWVIKESIRQLGEWRRTLGGISHLVVSLNLTPHEFARAGLFNTLETVLVENGVPGNRVHLELEEEILSGDVKLAVDLSRKLQEMGICLAFEEFGVGHSALSSLRAIRWDRVKVARKFGVAFDSSPEQQQWLRALTHMAQDLNIECLAKAIESDTAASQFRELGYELGQGFLFYKPMGPKNFEALVKEGKAS